MWGPATSQSLSGPLGQEVSKLSPHHVPGPVPSRECLPPSKKQSWDLNPVHQN